MPRHSAWHLDTRLPYFPHRVLLLLFYFYLITHKIIQYFSYTACTVYNIYTYNRVYSQKHAPYGWFMGFSRVIPDISDFEFMHCHWSITQRKMWLHCTISTTARATARSFTIKMENAKHSKCLQFSQPQVKLQLSKMKSLSQETMMKIQILQHFLLVSFKKLIFLLVISEWLWCFLLV